MELILRRCTAEDIDTLRSLSRGTHSFVMGEDVQNDYVMHRDM